MNKSQPKLEPVSQLQEELDKMKDMKLGHNTGFAIIGRFIKDRWPYKKVVITDQEIKKLLKK